MTAPLAHWRYAAESANGEIIKGAINAPDERTAIAKLEEKRLTPLTLELAPTLRDGGMLSHRLSRDLKLSELAAITRRISDLLTAGLPLAKALQLARDQSATERLQSFYTHLEDQVRSGKSLSAALQSSDIKAPPFMEALIRTGENIGALPAQFAVLADQYESALKMRREIIAQLVYPAALLVLILLTMIFLSFFVLPQFALIFENAAAEPPVETRLALAVGSFIRSYLAYSPLILLGLVLAWRYLKSRYSTQIEALMLTAPVIGPIWRMNEIGRYCRSLSTVLKGGMTLAGAMPLARSSVEATMIRNQLEQTETAVRTGSRLPQALEVHATPPREVTSFLEVGDETGTLGEMTGQAAQFTEARVNDSVKRFMALLSPVLTAIMGLATAGVIAAVMSGVLSLNDAVY